MAEYVLRRVQTDDVMFGDKTGFTGRILHVHARELQDYLLQDRHLQSVEIAIARPGESKRIIPVKDVIEPRIKIGDEHGQVFPGFSGKVHTVGRGTTAVLDGVAVVTCGRMVHFQEGLIDMCGHGAEFTLFSKKINLILVMEPVAGLSKEAHEQAVREAGLRAAGYLAEQAIADAPDYEEERYPLTELHVQTDLPRVVYINLTIAQGLLHDNYYYGVNAQGCLPCLMTPTEVFDGAVVSGNCAAPCHKHTTYHQQNNPIVEDLLQEHGKSLWLTGMIVSPVKTALAEKDRNCSQVLKLARMLQAEGAIISEDGGGNPETDLMTLARLFEGEGIKTVLVTDEYAGRDGGSPGLADVTREADAIVTNGNGNQYVTLPPMDETIGHLEAIRSITGGNPGSLRDDGSIEMEIAGIMGSTVELGAEHLTTIAV